jgi:(p)ppGpp synthase/HD superfamily hydrolase
MEPGNLDNLMEKVRVIVSGSHAELLEKLIDVLYERDMEEPEIEKAVALALEVHRGQKDKAGEPYILHPLRVMSKMDTDIGRVVAVLHDVIEDGGKDAFIKADFPQEVYQYVGLLSRREGQPCHDYLSQVEQEALTIEVKIADLEDNLNPERIARLLKTGADERKVFERVAKYEKAKERLLKAYRATRS